LERALVERPPYLLVWIFFSPMLSHVVISPLCSCLQCWPMFGVCRCPVSPRKSKVMTGLPRYLFVWVFSHPRAFLSHNLLSLQFSFAPSYPLDWMFCGLVHSCATVHTLCWLGSTLMHAGCQASRSGHRALGLKRRELGDNHSRKK
jgi:hypothetical protein